MFRRLIAMLALLLDASFSSASVESCEIPKEGYDLISIFPPEIQAEIEAKKPKPQFLGVLNYSLVVPGVSGSALCWSHEGLVSIVPGTTDAPCSQALLIYQHAVGLYARDFNKQLLALAPSGTTYLHQGQCAVAAA